MAIIFCVTASLVITPSYVVNGLSVGNNSSYFNEKNAAIFGQTRIDKMPNPDFTFFNETSGLPTYWNDPTEACRDIFSCTVKLTVGWNDLVSFALSTTDNKNDTWSSIKGRVIPVETGKKYQIVSHMKLNDWAMQSHVGIEGFNVTSDRWYQITQCPSGLNGPLEWKEFSCIISIPGDTTKIRPVLNAGWSSKPNNEATTWFDSINILTNVS